MNRCAGCDREADRVSRHNDSIFFCTPCTKILPALKTKEVDGLAPNYCPTCDERLWHGEIVCISCVEELLTCWLQVESIDNHPLVYELVLPSIRFHQGNGMWNGDYIRSEFWYDLRLPDGVHTISFQALREAEGMMIRLEPPRCSCCDKPHATMAKSTTWDDFYVCGTCQTYVSQWLDREDLGHLNPIIDELFCKDDRHWRNRPDASANTFMEHKFKRLETET